MSVGCIKDLTSNPKAFQKYSLVFTLIDKSSAHISINVFANNLGDFPSCSTGDIMRWTKVRVEIFNNHTKLVGNVTACKSTFVTYHRKFDYSTGFPVAKNDTINIEHFRVEDWEISFSGSKFLYDPSIDLLTVKQLTDWSAGYFSTASLVEDGMASAEMTLVEVHTNTIGFGCSKGYCDVSCLVAAVSSTGSGANQVTTILVWDGTTTGELKTSATISTSTIKNIQKSLHAANVFAENTQNRVSLESLRGLIEAPSQPLTMYGTPLAISSQPQNKVMILV